MTGCWIIEVRGFGLICVDPHPRINRQATPSSRAGCSSGCRSYGALVGVDVMWWVHGLSLTPTPSSQPITLTASPPTSRTGSWPASGSCTRRRLTHTIAPRSAPRRSLCCSPRRGRTMCVSGGASDSIVHNTHVGCMHADWLIQRTTHTRDPASRCTRASGAARARRWPTRWTGSASGPRRRRTWPSGGRWVGRSVVYMHGDARIILMVDMTQPNPTGAPGAGAARAGGLDLHARVRARSLLLRCKSMMGDSVVVTLCGRVTCLVSCLVSCMSIDRHGHRHSPKPMWTPSSCAPGKPCGSSSRRVCESAPWGGGERRGGVHTSDGNSDERIDVFG